MQWGFWFCWLWAGALGWPAGAGAQTWREVRTVPLTQPVHLSVDRYGNYYVADAAGNLDRYDSLGQFALHYSPPKLAQITQLEARPTVRIFAFYRELQEYKLLNRFLTPLETYPLAQASSELGFVRLAAPSLDNQLWLFDDVQFALYKYDKNQNQTSFKAPLDLLLGQADYDFNQMAEYQNQLFINDRNSGILVFDNLGNYRRRLGQPTEHFDFYGNEVYYLHQGQLWFEHLYTGAKRSLPLPPALAAEALEMAYAAPWAAVLTRNRLVVLQLEEP
ncbi:MAG: hypothetical protein MUC97_02225 [Bernardetiaceae bacterium]|nr:hypothetical protein [Bernardetiaceae bacterium]